MKNIIFSFIILSGLMAGCKKDTIIGGAMTVKRTNTSLQVAEVNIFSPNGDARNDHFFGPVILYTIPGDSVISSSLNWSNSNKEGVYGYTASYTTAGGGTLSASGLVRLWKSSPIPCDEESLLRFGEAYDNLLQYNSASPANERVPCK